MATDVHALLANLLSFRDFTNLDILAVGAGGGQLIEYARPARHVTAVDRNADAIARLKERLEALGLQAKVTPLLADFSAFDRPADLVLFEFCLHEIAEPRQALAHALEIAPEVVVIDHAPDSPWAFLGGEDECARRSWEVVAEARPVRERTVTAEQIFSSYDELDEKLRGQGELALTRSAAYRGRTAFSIPMIYRLALVQR